MKVAYNQLQYFLFCFPVVNISSDQTSQYNKLDTNYRNYEWRWKLQLPWVEIDTINII